MQSSDRNKLGYEKADTLVYIRHNTGQLDKIEDVDFVHPKVYAWTDGYEEVDDWTDGWTEVETSEEVEYNRWRHAKEARSSARESRLSRRAAPIRPILGLEPDEVRYYRPTSRFSPCLHCSSSHACTLLPTFRLLTLRHAPIAPHSLLPNFFKLGDTLETTRPYYGIRKTSLIPFTHPACFVFP